MPTKKACAITFYGVTRHNSQLTTYIDIISCFSSHKYVVCFDFVLQKLYTLRLSGDGDVDDDDDAGFRFNGL